MTEALKAAREALVARLRKPEHSEETMLWWDKLRARIKKDNGSGPRDDFENFLDTIDEERTEAADALEAALAENERLKEKLGAAAGQKLVREMDGEMYDAADFEDGYEALVENARAALADLHESRDSLKQSGDDNG